MKINILILIIIIFFFNLPRILFGLQASYCVGSGDILSINVWGESDLDKEVVVDQDGTINYPLLSNVHVAGLSIKQIDDKITRMLELDYLVNPEVGVRIIEYHSQKILVLGEIKNPGLYVLTGVTSLLEIISRAGGVSDNVGNKISIFRSIEHRRIASGSEDITTLTEGISPISIDPDELLKKGNLAYNIPLQSEDVIIFADKKDANILEQKVYISGQIKRPGAYDYQKGLTALNLCIMAGGFEKAASSNRAILTRNVEEQRKVFKINLNMIKKGKKQDIQLQSGDRLYIPESFW